MTVKDLKDFLRDTPGVSDDMVLTVNDPNCDFNVIDIFLAYDPDTKAKSLNFSIK